MATITEDYVSFETAKLLKDKGFDELCAWQYYTYWEGGKLKNYKNPILLSEMLNNSNVIGRDNVTAPTQQMVCKWLRIKYNIHVEQIPYVTTDGFFWAYKILGGIIAPNVIPLPNYCVKRLKESSGFLSCEQATEAAIEYCLDNLI